MRSFIKTTFIILLAIIATLQGCGKYEDGPMFSLRSIDKRIHDDWHLKKYLKNDIDITSDFLATHKDYMEVYDEETYSIWYDNGQYAWDKWEFQNDKLEIKRAKGNSFEILHILKLKKRGFWYWYMDGADRIEIQMVNY